MPHSLDHHAQIFTMMLTYIYKSLQFLGNIPLCELFMGGLITVNKFISSCL